MPTNRIFIGYITTAAVFMLFVSVSRVGHAQGLTEDQLSQIATTYVQQGLGGKNFDAIPYADNVSVRAPIGPNGSRAPFVGIESVRDDWWSPLPSVLGDVRLIDTHVNETLDGVTAEFHLNLTTDPTVTLRIIDRFRVNNEGKIVEQENFFDPRDFTAPWRVGPTDVTQMPRQGASIGEAQLRGVGETYIDDGLGGGSFDAIPYAADAQVRAPIGPNGSWTPFVGIDSIRDDWWAPLPGILGDARLIDTFVNQQRDTVTAEFHLDVLTDPPSTLRIVDRFVVNGDGEIIEQENFFDPRPLTDPSRELSWLDFNWRSEGTFAVLDAEATQGAAENDFVGAASTTADVSLVDVEFDHSIDARADGSLRLFDGSFTIVASNGDRLFGQYQDFDYTPNDPEPGFTGIGDFTISGGTGIFAGASGSGSWDALAAFTSNTGGIADHNWSGSLTLVPEPGSLSGIALGLAAVILFTRRTRQGA